MSSKEKDSLVDRIKDYSTEHLKYIINLGSVGDRIPKNATRETLEQHAFVSMLNLFNQPTKIKELINDVTGDNYGK